MEHFTQEDVDRMIQEAAQAAKNKKGSSSGEDAAKPAGAKPVSTGAVPPQQTVDPVEEVLASMNQAPEQTPPKTKEKPPAETKNKTADKPETPPKKTVPEPVAEQPQPEPVEDIPAEPKPEEYEAMVTEPVADKDDVPVETKNEEKPSEPETVEEPVVQTQAKPEEEKITPPETKIEDTEIKPDKPVENVQPPNEPEPQPVKPAETKIDPEFAALSSEQVYTFVMELIKDLSDAKVELAKMQVDLEIERLKNQASSFFKKQ